MFKIVLLLVFVAVVWATFFYKAQEPLAADVKNGTYIIDGKAVKLTNGVSEAETGSGAGSKIITEYFGNEAKGDLNADGKEDTAFVLTQDGKDSGTLYYLAAALGSDGRYQGTNAVPLGGRIAPKTTEIQKGEIVVNYANGSPAYFAVQDGALVEVKNTKEVDFSSLNPGFAFSASIPAGFKAEYIPGENAINVYDPSSKEEGALNKSQMFITWFRSDRFLVLNTVDILSATNKETQGKQAIFYTIAKKQDVPDFAGQPAWRNAKHEALDIRVSGDSPSDFYSIAKNPGLSENVFEAFVESLKFHDKAKTP